MADASSLFTLVKYNSVIGVVAYTSLYEIFQHEFKDPKLLKQALIHPSKRTSSSENHYERLEFLGDRVLGLVIAHLLYIQYPKEEEGKLAKRHSHLVSRETLIQVARQISLEDFVDVSKSVSQYNDRRKESILADACESVIAALYLDGGMDVVRSFIQSQWQPLIDGMTTIPKDAKSTLQEWAQGRGKNNTPPVYRVLDHSGPQHAPMFTVEVTVEGLEPTIGTAASKRLAQQAAAQALLDTLKLSPPKSKK